MPKEPKTGPPRQAPLILMQINPSRDRTGGKLQPPLPRAGLGAQGRAGGGLSTPDLTQTPVFSKISPLPTSHFSSSVGKKEELKAKSQELQFQLVAGLWKEPLSS